MQTALRVRPGLMQMDLSRLPQREEGQGGDQEVRELVLDGREGGEEAVGGVEDLLS